MTDINEDTLRELAHYDWVYASRCDRLHAPAKADYDAEEWYLDDVTMACGWQVDEAFIPGVLSRMVLPRCAHCCDRLGYPRGQGSPKNDDACRALLGLGKGGMS